LAKVWDADGTGAEPPSATTSDAVAAEPVLSITGQGNLQGTLSYMSPEQVRRDPDIDYRSDIYSLGVVLYEILVGHTPSTATTVGEMIEDIEHNTPPPPSKSAQAPVPKLLDSLVMRCIAKAPERRVQQWSELIRLLQEDWSIKKRAV
jgi:serine/threonine protein kinase